MIQRLSIENDDENNGVLFKSPSSVVIISPFDDIPMKDIDAESSTKASSGPKDGSRTKNKTIDRLFSFLR